MLKKREKEVLIQLLMNARMPDKHIAKILGTTQPTVTRIRQKLEKAGYIKNYKPVVSFQKFGVGIIVLTLFRIDFSKIDEIKKEVLPELKKMPQIILVAAGEGMGKTSLIVSVHKDFKEFEEMMIEMRKKWEKYIQDVEHFIFSVDKIYKEFSVEDAIIALLKSEK
ncbi:MAG: Lrp/AsnC family transcriptional regulator [Candidatus Aenigmatarchaeota archaeon]